MNFTWLTGDVNWRDYGGKWISSRLNNGDWDYWLVIEFINMDEACGRDNAGQPAYHVDISAVSPAAAGEAGLEAAARSCGVELSELKHNPVVQVEMLHSYGCKAHLWSKKGRNAHKLLREAKREAQLCEMTFGFRMDGPQNKVGSTGWEFIKGDVMAGVRRAINSGTPEGNILGKMHGLKPGEA